MKLRTSRIRMQNKYTQFGGGYDAVTPSLDMRPGTCRASQNAYQDINGGYKPFQGYERYDGQAKPSAASYGVLAVNSVAGLTVGSIYTDTATGAYGTIIVISEDCIVLTKVVGTFSETAGITGYIRDAETDPVLDAEGDLIFDGETTLTTGGGLVIDGAPTPKLHAQYLNLAADEYRDDILAVGGTSCTGAVLGVWYYEGQWYAFRNNTAETQALMFEDSASGWTQKSLGYELAFTSGGSYTPQEGDIVEGVTSGAIATITRVVLETGTFAGTYSLPFTSGGTYEVSVGDTITGATSGATAVVLTASVTSGTWAGGDAAGTITFSSQNGTFQSEDLNVGANSNVASISGDSTVLTGQNATGRLIFASITGAFSSGEILKVTAQTKDNIATTSAVSSAITLQPDGSYEFVNTNFTGSTDTLRMYGVDGINRGFEYDGDIFTPITTGMASDNPSHIIAHKYHLFYSYLGSVQHSGTGLPYQWTLVTGGDEIGLGDTVTGFISVPGSESDGTLACFTRDSIAMLYGSGIADWNLVHFRNEAGAIEWSPQRIGNVFMLDDRGVAKLSTSTAYGNFADATASKPVQPWLATRKNQLTASVIVRDLNQLWLFFADKSALCCTIVDGDIVASMPMLFPHKVTCACSSENSSGQEEVMIGTEDGYVLQMYKGTSFDGDDIEYFLDLAYDHHKTPFNDKQYRRAMLEAEGEGYAEFNFGYSLEYGQSSVSQPKDREGIVELSGRTWDVGVWDVGTYDGIVLTPEYFYMLGSASNISITIKGKSDYYSPIRFSGVITQFNFTRERR